MARRIRDVLGPADDIWVNTIQIGSTTISETELAVLDASTPGTVTASLGVVVDANKDIGDFRNLDAVNFDAGASGTAGTVDIFPTTAAKGKVALSAADSAGNTTTSIVNASQSGARTYTIPDAGASTSFLMAVGGQSPVFTNIDAGASGTAGTVDVFPTTASKGKLAISCTDQTGDTTAALVMGAQAAARTYTVPDAGVSAANVVLTSMPNVARTATADGLTTGTIADGTTFVTVTSADANNIIVLPTPTPGVVVSLLNGATGYELRTSAPATISINGGAGANAESAIGANVLVVARCVSATAWIGTNYSTAGTVSATEVAA